jgi:outer membrane lipoprotein-sorting protein
MRWLMACLIPAAVGCYAQSAEEILAKVAETYKSTGSLRLELTTSDSKSHADSRFSESFPHSRNLTSRKVHAWLSLENPGKLRLRVQGSRSEELFRGTASNREPQWKTLDFQQIDFLAVSDGRTLWQCALDAPRQYTTQPVDPSYLDDLYPAMQYLVGRYRNLDFAREPHILKRGQLRRGGRAIRCVVIEAAGHELWIDEQRYLVLLDRGDGTTMNWKTAELNPKLSPRTFNFTPPKHTQQVTSLGDRQPRLP